MSKAQNSKEKGNEAFKQGKYADAIGFYTAAIIDNREEPTYPLNRAAAYLKLGKYEDAERDCTTVLALSPRNPKALFRRGQARLALGNLIDAEKDFDQASSLEPNNKAIDQALVDVAQRMAAKREKAMAATAAQKFVDPNPPRRRRVPIEIVDPPASIGDNTTAQVIDPPPSDRDLKAVSSRPLKPAEVPPAPKSSPGNPSNAGPTATTHSGPSKITPPENEKPSSFKEAKQTRDTVRPSRVGGGIFRASGPTTVFPTRDTHPISPEPSSLRQDAPIRKSAVKAPGNLSELIKAWGSQRTAEERWELLSKIEPSKFPGFCRTALEPIFLASIFEAIDEVLSTADLNKQIAVKSFLDYLPLVPRFNTIFLFLSKSEKAIVREVWKQLGVEMLDGVWASLLK